MRQHAKYAAIAYSHKTDMPSQQSSTVCFFTQVSTFNGVITVRRFMTKIK